MLSTGHMTNLYMITVSQHFPFRLKSEKELNKRLIDYLARSNKVVSFRGS